MKHKLTIGIATYKRPDSLIKLLLQTASLDEINSNAQVVVINDSGTREYIEQYNKLFSVNEKALRNLNLKIIHNESNLGLPLTFAALIGTCETDYFMFMADDDLFVPGAFTDILFFLERIKPELLSPIWISNRGKVGRGIKETRKVIYREFRLCSGHAPGVIFKTNSTREFIKPFKKLVATNNVAALTYPLVIFSVFLIIKHNNSWWINIVLVKEGDNMPSNLKDNASKPYNAISSRIRQIVAFDSFILSLDECPAKDVILLESRAWSFQKALGADTRLKERVLFYISPPLSYRIKRKIKKSVLFASWFK